MIEFVSPLISSSLTLQARMIAGATEPEASAKMVLLARPKYLIFAHASGSDGVAVVRPTEPEASAKMVFLTRPTYLHKICGEPEFSFVAGHSIREGCNIIRLT